MRISSSLLKNQVSPPQKKATAYGKVTILLQFLRTLATAQEQSRGGKEQLSSLFKSEAKFDAEGATFQ